MDVVWTWYGKQAQARLEARAEAREESGSRGGVYCRYLEEWKHCFRVLRRNFASRRSDIKCNDLARRIGLTSKLRWIHT